MNFPETLSGSLTFSGPWSTANCWYCKFKVPDQNFSKRSLRQTLEYFLSCFFSGGEREAHMKNKANRRMKEKTNTLSMLCVFPSRCCGGRSFVCVLSIFRLLGLKLMDIRRLFKCRRAAERQTLEKEKGTV